ncbi:hypothetical protein [Magnetofaba australis]|uniref:hypothetical protein n=1 Tax=Magnetofaba australis TaxID=1472297 RepID=UPI000A19E848|nr:hypothetical protein [Magnetofaba australis]
MSKQEPANLELVDGGAEIISEDFADPEQVILATEEIPLDNRCGSSALVSEHEFTRSANVNFEWERGRDIADSIQGELLNLVETKAALHIKRKLGIHIGGQVRRSVRLRFNVSAGDFVRYRIVWLQEQRRGVFLVPHGKRMIEAPYLVTYGLHHSVESLPGASKEPPSEP